MNAPNPKNILRKLMILLLNFIIAYGLLRIIITLGERLQNPLVYYIGSSAYMVALAGLVIAFFVLNGCTLDNRIPLPEELPEEWNLAEKRAYLDKLSAGKAKAKRLLFVLLPLIVTVAVSYIELWFFQ